jgi:hypothetical protein
MRQVPASARAVPPRSTCAYTRAGVDHYMGSYLTIRPAFAKRASIMAYRTDITWDEEWPSLLFQESERPDKPFLHRGRLYIPASSMYIHLVSLTKGAMRMVMVSQLDPAGIMRGLITTLHKQKASLVPVSAPIVYVKQDEFSSIKLGEVEAGDAAFAAYRQLIEETVAQGYAKLIELPT